MKTKKYEYICERCSLSFNVANPVGFCCPSCKGTLWEVPSSSKELKSYLVSSYKRIGELHQANKDLLREIERLQGKLIQQGVEQSSEDWKANDSLIDVKNTEELTLF